VRVVSDVNGAVAVVIRLRRLPVAALQDPARAVLEDALEDAVRCSTSHPKGSSGNRSEYHTYGYRT
jgi:hypothetical protein